MKRLINVLVVGIFTCSSAFGQAIDENKMERDIEVAENILGTLMNQKDNQDVVSYMGRSPFKGNYVSGYGVIFGAPRGVSRIFLSRGDGFSTYSLGKPRGQAVVVSSSSGELLRVSDDEKVNADSLKDALSDSWIDNVKTFMTDYAHLIGQLQPEDKIVVTDGPSGFGDRKFFMRSKINRTSVEVKKRDLDAFHSGKMSRDQLMKTIKVSNNATAAVEKDVELMASIFETLYKQDLSDTYYVSGGIYAEKMPDLGVILQMNVYSSVSERDGLHRIVTQNLSGLTQEERNIKVKDMYPKFLDDLKHNIVQYGRTVKSIAGDERLLFNIQLTQCRGCGIPESLELSIKGSGLASFNAGKISEDKAIELISVKEIGQQ